MIWDNPVLERMIEQETFAEIITRLTPGETAVALLRADGLDDQEIADALGITRAAVQYRMKKAVERISRQRPEAGRMLAGRDRFRTASRCLTSSDEQDMISSSEAARILCCTRQTIRKWIAAGRFPRAEPMSMGDWQIPRSDVERLA